LRYNRNFNPEWGYVAPAASTMRMARLIAAATIIGASAGAATVFSLLDRPVLEGSVAARTLVVPEPKRPVMNSPSVAAPQPTGLQQIKSPAEGHNFAEQKAPPTSAIGGAASPQPNELATIPQHPASDAALTEAPAVKELPSVPTVNDTVAIAADPAPAPKPPTKKPRLTARSPTDASRYGRRYDRHFDGPRYGYDPGYGYEPRYGSRGSFAWEQY